VVGSADTTRENRGDGHPAEKGSYRMTRPWGEGKKGETESRGGPMPLVVGGEGQRPLDPLGTMNKGGGEPFFDKGPAVPQNSREKKGGWGGTIKRTA